MSVSKISLKAILFGSVSTLGFMGLYAGCGLSTNTNSTINATARPDSVAVKTLRWTTGSFTEGSLSEVLVAIRKSAGITLSENSFEIFDERDLATHHFTLWSQKERNAGQFVSGLGIRVWKSLTTGQVIQVEADVADEVVLQRAMQNHANADFAALERRAPTLLAAMEQDNKSIRDIRTSLVLQHGKPLIRLIVKAARGEHIFDFTDPKNRPVSTRYRSFSYTNALNKEDSSDEFSVPAQVFAVTDAGVTRKYGDNGVRGSLSSTTLRYIKKRIPKNDLVRYLPLEGLTFRYSKLESSLKQISDADFSQGFWNYSALLGRLQTLAKTGEHVSNTFGFGNPVRLVGRYAAVYWHPNAAKNFGIARGDVRLAPAHNVFEFSSADGDAKAWATRLHYGVPLRSGEDALKRAALVAPAETKPALQIMREGFDEVQTYDMVNRFFDTLHGYGFTDPELSTRPVNVVLFNPDVVDNAYSTLEGEINFGTYEECPSMARNNPTGWHELGHELVARLASPDLSGVAAGGLHEGVADLIANLIQRDVADPTMSPMNGDPRPYNTTLFNFNGESHDAGEAFGGALIDLEDLAQARWGAQEGLARVADLVFEGLRLIRANPNLTAESWYQHLVYADSLEREGKSFVRRPGEMTALLQEVFAQRNLRMNETETLARFDVASSVNGEEYVVWQNDVESQQIVIANQNSANTPLSIRIRVSDGDVVKLKYPLTGKLALRPATTGAAVKYGEDGAINNLTLTQPINASGESVELATSVFGRCPINAEIISIKELKYRVCRSRFSVNLVESQPNPERPANHLLRGNLVLQELMR